MHVAEHDSVSIGVVVFFCSILLIPFGLDFYWMKLG